MHTAQKDTARHTFQVKVDARVKLDHIVIENILVANGSGGRRAYKHRLYFIQHQREHFLQKPTFSVHKNIYNIYMYVTQQDILLLISINQADRSLNSKSIKYQYPYIRLRHTAHRIAT